MPQRLRDGWLADTLMLQNRNSSWTTQQDITVSAATLCTDQAAAKPDGPLMVQRSSAGRQLQLSGASPVTVQCSNAGRPHQHKTHQHARIEAQRTLERLSRPPPGGTGCRHCSPEAPPATGAACTHLPSTCRQGISNAHVQSGLIYTSTAGLHQESSHVLKQKQTTCPARQVVPCLGSSLPEGQSPITNRQLTSQCRC